MTAPGFGLNLYVDYHFPLPLIQLINDLLVHRQDPTIGQVATETTRREWYSQPRPSTDATVEVVTINYKLPMSVSHFSAEFLRQSARAEVWYKDRNNNWRQVVDRQRVPLVLALARSAAVSWYTYATTVYPIVAKAVQVRIVRVHDPELPTVPYSVGLRNTLVKRDIRDRSQGVQDMEDEQDVMGNVISKTIKDWDAARAIDGDTTTFWRSAPMPDPAAVVSLYLDVRTVDGLPQTLDKLYLDPVHSGQQLNLYFTSDDTVGTRTLSPISLPPEVDVNTEWRAGRGRWDMRGAQDAQYAFRAYWGPQQSVSAWVGMEWYPDFDAANGPSLSPILLKANPPAQQTAYSPEIIYDPGAGQFLLTFRRSGYAPVTFTASIGATFVHDEPLRIVAGWDYDPGRVRLQVRKRSTVIADLTATVGATLPTNVAFDGLIETTRFRGLLTAQVIKLGESCAGQLETFMANPTVYVSPDPVLPDALGNVPPGTLDNAIYSADWTQQRYGVGGSDASQYAEKLWVPIWKNYVAEKGMLFFPQMITAKYLKLEFTNLSEEPYPVYESGIDVTYKVFPTTVTSIASLLPKISVGISGSISAGGVTLAGGARLDVFNPKTTLDLFGRASITRMDPIKINIGPGYEVTTVPANTPALRGEIETELSKAQVYRRDEISPYTLAQNDIYTMVKADALAKLEPYTAVPWEEIYAANPGAMQARQDPGAIAVRGAAYWVYPGQDLRVPAAVMDRITATATVTERRLTLEWRQRFTTSAVHRYETRTVRRDAAIAYFAGVREVTPFVSSYVYGQDRESFDFPLYSPDQWTYTNIEQWPNGVITWNGSGTNGVASFSFQTYSNFVRVFCEFRDSGLLRSDALWASATSDRLSPNASVIPPTMDGSAWSDAFVEWTDTVAAWGAARGVVAVNLDGDRRYQGRRVLRFDRAAGGGEAGLRLHETTHYLDGALYRLGAVVYKPFANDNLLIVRLVRRSDAAIVYQTQIPVPVGRWFEFTGDLQPVPAGTGQDYNLELVLSGDDEDRLYVSDLYSELAHVRYFVRGGGAGSPTHEVTELRYRNSATVVAQQPVTQGLVQVTFCSDESFAYGCRVVPDYRQ